MKNHNNKFEMLIHIEPTHTFHMYVISWKILLKPFKTFFLKLCRFESLFKPFGENNHIHSKRTGERSGEMKTEKPITSKKQSTIE